MMLNCSRCIGVCCVSGGAVNVTPEDKERLANHMKMSVESFSALFVTTENGIEIIKRHLDPCPFLQDGNCSVHEARPAVCQEYFCWNRRDLSFNVATQLFQAGVTTGTVKIYQREDGIDVELRG